uniref:FGGY-family carbohydrate kinase n=1 Tax=Hydrogenophaga sp. TaxID=1904254 RepID=UPI0035642311
SAEAQMASPLFLPYLAGERTPHNDAQVRGSFHGLDFDTDAARLGYAVIEGVSLGLKDGMAALQAAGCHIGTLSLVGGGARSAFWAQLLSSALDTEVVTHDTSAVGGALGAARLAWLATGTPPAEVCRVPPVLARYQPDNAEQERLEARYTRFRSLYRRA